MLTNFALNNRTLMVAAVLICLIAGPLSFLSHPSREDPSITIRSAIVVAQFPGMSADRVENLITRQLEQKIREIPQVRHIESTSSNGKSSIKVEVRDQYADMAPIWSDLRNKMEDVRPDLPSGTAGPRVYDDQGNVAMATIAITAEGFENYEMREAAKELRRIIYANVPGVRKVDFFGVEEQRVFVEFDNIRISQLGIDPNAIINSITRQNVILPGGRVEVDGTTMTIEPTGDFGGLEDLSGLSVRIDGDPPTTIYLRDIANVRLGYAEPAETPAFYNGKPAVVVGVSMIEQVDSKVFSAALKEVVWRYQNGLPWGFELSFITFQQNEIDEAVSSVLNNLWQTCLIVLAVVVAFLGLRTGLIVGAMVPLVMLISTLVMRQAGIELERMSLAALIISLGLLVDNGIVVAEDMQGRIQSGQERIKAALESGRTLMLPLLAASLTTILAFMPLMLAPGAAGEYTRSISLVIAIALSLSWVVALTILLLVCVWFMKAGAPQDENAAYRRWYYSVYRGMLRGAIRFRWLVLLAAVAFLGFGGWMFQFVGKTFFPASERTQLQVIVELPVGANTMATAEAVERITDWLSRDSQNPEVENVAGYIASGGPRFYLSLAPVDGYPNNAYLIVNVKRSQDVVTVRERLKAWAVVAVPQARVTPKVMSMGPSESGLVEFRLIGPDSAVLSRVSEALMAALRAAPDTIGIKSDWENPTVALQVIVDQNAARRAGISSEDIANALNTQLAGNQVTVLRVNDVTIPVVLRAQGEQRTNLDRVRTLNVGVVGKSAVPLLQVAKFDGQVSYSRIKRRDLRRVMTVSGKSTTLTAQELDAAIASVVTQLQVDLPPGYAIEKGGEIEGSSQAQGNLFANLPLAFALMVLVLIWQFDSIKKPVIILLTIPLVITGVSAGLLIFPGANFSFMGILGFLALSGIVINNAIVLLDRIDIELAAGRSAFDAVVEAGVRRLRPIVMTTCTTALGLAPIILSRDVLFYDLAVVIAGGLTVGTVLTLFIAPSLYAVFYRVRAS
ncbi:MAG: multidrug efflux pump subunit AcrB [Gammaproteobacteria bacterium]|jgi:multidrug efflux pump subunit AcrB